MTIAPDLTAAKHPYPARYTTPFILYPPALWANKVGNAFTANLGLDEVGQDFVLYLSVPFCRVRCLSCPYFIDLLAPRDPHGKEARYVDAVIRDLEHWASYRRFQTGKLRAVYLGGGTGSILSTPNLKRIVDTIITNFPHEPELEVTLEGNARDYTDDKLDYVADSPISRVSLGVQSFDAGLLRTIGSPHAAEQSTRAITGLTDRGFENIQIDMMYNMPGHRREIWQADLNRLRDLAVKHLTTYLYRVHPGTPQDKLINIGRVQPLLDKESTYVRSMYADLVESTARAGFRTYMFDHYCVPGWENTYNEWTFHRNNVEILGVGPSAYGFINNYRIGAKKDVEEYIAAVGRGEHMITAVSDQLTPQVRRERYVINVLQYFGVDLDEYQRCFGSEFLDDFRAPVDRIINRSLATLEGRQLTLTELGREWHMNVMLEFTNDMFWQDSTALSHPHWAMNTPMVDLFAGSRESWLGAS
ncbi:coproporphyrinogen III oxidase family protein [Frankia sp. Ag45/Mut15]|uniref:Heme chaperone HemW n=1 Tax=Frankia umida TaxID=573489 RepID=A0ABT0JSU1_9ACTN|nr:coproporphyrinogen-III oxidase family protein [Frankia umida]MCK9874637.1 coproporphyrinogen III oxidase family protein [Frankia umida]